MAEEMTNQNVNIEGAGTQMETEKKMQTFDDILSNKEYQSEFDKRVESVVVALAVIAFDRMGTEGNASRSEGGLSLSFIDGLPADLQSRLTNYPRKVRVMHDASKVE